MNEIQAFIQYFISLFQSLYDSSFSLTMNTDYNEINEYIYNYFNNDNTDFSEFDNDYYNFDQLKNIDRKSCLYNLMFSVYYLISLYEKNIGNFNFDYLYSSEFERNKFLNDLFKNQDICFDIIDTFMTYIDYSDARKRKISTYFSGVPNFIDLCKKNKYICSIFLNNFYLNISEDAQLIDDISEIYDNIYLSSDDNYSSIEADVILDSSDFYKVKKMLMIRCLIDDINCKKNNYLIKHYFSVMIKNLYSDIYFSKINNFKNLSNYDNNFYKLIDDNMVTYDELFLAFIKDNNFSNYIIESFYFNNVYRDTLDFKHNEILFNQYNLKEKIKKYYK